MTPEKRAMYVGLAKHQLDAKNRLTLPSRWRLEGDSGEYLAIPAQGGFLHVLPPRMVDRLEERVSQVSLGDEEGQGMLMEMFSRAHAFTYDRQGRFGLNEDLIRFAGIEKETLFVGNFTSFYIWSPERYEQRPKPSKSQNEILKELGL